MNVTITKWDNGYSIISEDFCKVYEISLANKNIYFRIIKDLADIFNDTEFCIDTRLKTVASKPDMRL